MTPATRADGDGSVQQPSVEARLAAEDAEIRMSA
jgi:hypothetical protein